jgi:hypothetical protein
MIYSIFGSQLNLVSKQQDASGRLTLQGTAAGSTDIREYNVRDLKADDGRSEIDQTVSKLPWKVAVKSEKRSIRV